MDIKDIINHWNSKEIIIHSLDTMEVKKTIRFIERRNINLTDLKTAIDNYSMILHDEEYWFKYKWNVSHFVGIRIGCYEKFLENGEHYINYMLWKEKLSNSKEVKPANNIFENDIEVKELNKIHKDLINKYKTISYCKYLYTEHWISFKEAALKNARYTCQLCSKDHTELNVHHKTYENRGQETFNDVIVLCKECHAKFHNKVS